MKTHRTITGTSKLPRLAVQASTFALCVLGSSFAATSAYAAGTVAGTDIINIATATYDAGGGPTTVNSNTSTIKVDELLNVLVASGNAGDVPTSPGATTNVQTFRVTNTGNGAEKYSLTANVTVGGDDFNPVLTQIYLDANNNGQYDQGVDTPYTAGSNDPSLNPDTNPTGSSIFVFVVTSTPATVTDGQRAQVDLRAVAVTGSGPAGTTFTGAGQGGGDAVVGASTADQKASGFLKVTAAAVALTKTATVLDPQNGTHPIPGAIITYTLTATVSGSGSVNGLVIGDPVPAGTTYQPNSITLGGVAQSDAVDTDAGSISGTQISVNAGTVAGGQTRVVTFKAKINP